MGPYLKRRPRNWFLPLMGPADSAAPDILTLLDLSERPRTMPDNHEVLLVAFGGSALGDVAVDADDKREDVEETDRFISRGDRKRHRCRKAKSSGTR